MTVTYFMAFLTNIFLLKSAVKGLEDGYHIRVLVAYPIPPFLVYKWDSSGNLSEASGVLPPYLDLIAQRFRIKYSWLPIGKALLVEDTPTQKGLMTYLNENKADLAIGMVVPTTARYRYVDFTTPVLETTFAIIIPMPTIATDKSALLRPFGLEVWVSLGVCFMAAIAAWNSTNLIRRKILVVDDKMERSKDNFYFPLAYTLSVLLAQGNSAPKPVDSIRLIAAVWCLAALVLVPAYSGNLTSFLSSPLYRPVINSVQDIITSVPTGLKVAVEKGLGVDIQLQSWENSFLMGTMNTTVGKMAFAARNATLRCIKMETCIEKVVQGEHVAVSGLPQAMQLVRDDFKHSGKCRVTLAKQTFNKAYTNWIVAKGSSHTNIINQGILEIDAFGLSNFWRNYYAPRAEACLNSAAKHNRNRRLPLVYMSSTFILFLFGCGLAIGAFLCELFMVKKQI